MKKTLTMLLALCLACSAIIGCAGTAVQTEKPEETPLPTAAVLENNGANEAAENPPEVNATLPPASGNGDQGLSEQEGINNASFVLIYDPFRFVESDQQKSLENALNTGDIGPQIVIGLNRAGEQETGITAPQGMVTPTDLLGDFDRNEVERAGARAGGEDPVYRKGDTHAFYSYDTFMRAREKTEFSCVYAGSCCYIWSFEDAIDEATAEAVGTEFDTHIFETDKTYFGTPRFTENGGKVNILFRPFAMEGLGGFFCPLDNYSSGEVPEMMAEYYQMNTDHAIITINSNQLKTNMAYVYSTLAHELQHQICSSEAFYYDYSPYVETWLDETMSAYAEELNYPGIKVQGNYNLLMYLSDNYRKGQSLYNFDTSTDAYIGAYGAVYLFAEYLTTHAGEDVFSKVHAYWRNSYSATVTEAEALYASMPESFIAEIDAKYTFPTGISSRFATKEEEWLSKMTLDFFVETVSMELANATDFADKLHLFMMYSEINPLDIQGGGRVFVATEDGSFTFPEDSGKGLVFIGFDNEFNPQPELYSNVN